MAESLVRAQVRLGRLDLDFDERFPLEVARKLVNIGDSLKNVVAFLIDNSEDLFDNDDWKRELDDFFFIEKNRKYRFKEMVEQIEELTKFCEPESLAHIVVQEYSYFAGRAVIALTQIHDGHLEVAGTRLPDNIEAIVNNLNRTILDMQRYLVDREVRPVLMAKMCPIFSGDNETPEIDHLNLVSFALSIARALERGDDLADIASDVNTTSGVDLKIVLRELFETMPDIAIHINSLFFNSHNHKVDPWPFNSMIRQWNETLLDPNGELPEAYFTREGVWVSTAYLQELGMEFEEPHSRDNLWRSPFEQTYVSSIDDDGNEGLEIAFVSPGLVEPNRPTNRYYKYQIDQNYRDDGLVRTIILN